MLQIRSSHAIAVSRITENVAEGNEENKPWAKGNWKEIFLCNKIISFRRMEK